MAGLLSARENAGSAVAPAPVLDIQEVDLGEKSILYQRIATPPLQPPSPAESAPASPEATEAWGSDPVDYFLSCQSVKESGLSEVRWQAGGKELVFWSTIPFSRLRGISAFGPERFTTFLSWRELTLAELETGNAEVRSKGWPAEMLMVMPAAGAPAAGPLKYWLIGEVPARRVQEIAELHRLYDLHRAEIEQAAGDLEQARARHEQELRENPPPKDTVIRSFPIPQEAHP